jgi:ABC-type oligopeptide transport system ATPase subunit
LSVRSRVPEMTMPNDGGSGSGKSMGARAVTASEHDTRGNVTYGEPLGIELHRTVVVTSEATVREKRMSQTGSDKDVVKVEGS